MVGSEFCLLLLAVDNQDGAGVQVAVLGRFPQVPVLLEQDRVADSEPTGDDPGCAGEDRADQPTLLVLHLHLSNAGPCAIAAWLVGDGHDPSVVVGAVWSEWHSPAGFTWAQIFSRSRLTEAGPVVFAKGLGSGQRR